MSTAVWPYLPPAELKREEDASTARELAWLLDSLQETLADLKSGLEDCYALLAPIEPGSTRLSGGVLYEELEESGKIRCLNVGRERVVDIQFPSAVTKLCTSLPNVQMQNLENGNRSVKAILEFHTEYSAQSPSTAQTQDSRETGKPLLALRDRTNDVLHKSREEAQALEEVFIGADGGRCVHTLAGQVGVKEVKPGVEKHRWVHGAAVKAIAFCPWRDGLVATGGGSNDKCIHFFHTTSGTCLATISVAAQVTSLIWLTTRREIVATFGYAQPEHPYRIAVFSWPECKQIAAIPWEGEHRALYAISYPGGPNESQSQTSREGVRGLSRTATEGCIAVASSDERVKFHEVWAAGKKATVGGEGLLGGSDILEGLEGIDKEGDVIR